MKIHVEVVYDGNRWQNNHIYDPATLNDVDNIDIFKFLLDEMVENLDKALEEGPDGRTAEGGHSGSIS